MQALMNPFSGDPFKTKSKVKKSKKPSKKILKTKE